METNKQERMLEIFFRALRGEAFSVAELADEYGVSTKSISRCVNDLKAFLADHRDLVGNTELQYSYQEKKYHLYMEEFLTNREMLSIAEILIGARAFSKVELLQIIGKMQRFTTPEDRRLLGKLVQKELYHYQEVKHDCESIQQTLWHLANCIMEKHEITITYYKMDRSCGTHRILPASVLFADYYFYLIAYKTDDPTGTPVYFRADRIKYITEHRNSVMETDVEFDEGLLRQRSLLMWPGKLRKIRFLFSGPSVQAVLDKLPTAKILEYRGNEYLIEAEVYGDGIKMWLLSQGAWVKVTEPEEFVEEMRAEIGKMMGRYGD